MRPIFRLESIQNWMVSIAPSRIDSLPYSKIKAISNKYRQRLLASRRAPGAPSALPPAAVFLYQPTPTYAISPQLAARLTKSDISSLRSKLGVYEPLLSAEIDDIRWFGVEGQDYTPEYLIDPDLGRDQALYYGHRQFHVVSMLDMHRDEVRHDIQFDSAAALHIQLAEECFKGLIRSSEGSIAHNLGSAESWLLRNTQEGQQKLARAATMSTIPMVSQPHR